MNRACVCDLNGRVAIVTGGCGGLGAAQAMLLAHCGAAVLIADRRAAAAETSAALNRKGLEARALSMDVIDPTEWLSAINNVRDWKGRLDILINNAEILNRTNILDTQ